jgi:hypothetical protein
MAGRAAGQADRAARRDLAHSPRRSLAPTPCPRPRSEERVCRFCHTELRDWKPVMTEAAGAKVVTPYMRVSFNGKTYKVQVQPGPEGAAAFEKQIRSLLQLPEGLEFDVIFHCRAPGTGEAQRGAGRGTGRERRPRRRRRPQQQQAQAAEPCSRGLASPPTHDQSPAQPCRRGSSPPAAWQHPPSPSSTQSPCLPPLLHACTRGGPRRSPPPPSLLRRRYTPAPAHSSQHSQQRAAAAPPAAPPHAARRVAPTQTPHAPTKCTPRARPPRARGPARRPSPSSPPAPAARPPPRLPAPPLPPRRRQAAAAGAQRL